MKIDTRSNHERLTAFLESRRAQREAIAAADRERVAKRTARAAAVEAAQQAADNVRAAFDKVDRERERRRQHRAQLLASARKALSAAKTRMRAEDDGEVDEGDDLEERDEVIEELRRALESLDDIDGDEVEGVRRAVKNALEYLDSESDDDDTSDDDDDDESEIELDDPIDDEEEEEGVRPMKKRNSDQERALYLMGFGDTTYCELRSQHARLHATQFADRDPRRDARASEAERIMHSVFATAPTATPKSNIKNTVFGRDKNSLSHSQREALERAGWL